MRIVLFGTGAMSCLFAARLAAVAEVAMVGTWKEAIATICAQGVLLEDSQGLQAVQVKVSYLGDQPVPADLVLVLVKAWQTKHVAEYLEGYLKPRGLAVSLQNGLGNVECLGARAFPGTTAEGATIIGPGHVRQGGRGPTHMVAPMRVVDLLRHAGFEVYQCDLSQAESLLWGKLAVSCGINALTALLQVPNGELLARSDAEELMVMATMECQAVAQAKGIRLPYSDSASRVREVAERTATNKSSMFQDVLRGAPTECEAINGAVVREGRRLGIATPVNEVLWRLMRATIGQNRSDF